MQAGHALRLLLRILVPTSLQVQPCLWSQTTTCLKAIMHLLPLPNPPTFHRTRWRPLSQCAPMAVCRRSRNPTSTLYFQPRPPNALPPLNPRSRPLPYLTEVLPQLSQSWCSRPRHGGPSLSHMRCTTGSVTPRTPRTPTTPPPADAVSVTSSRPRKVYPPKLRHSRHLHLGRMGDSSPSGMNLQEAIQWGVLLLAPLQNQVLPMVDCLQRIIGVHAAALQGQEAYWALCVARATKAMGRLYRNGELGDLSQYNTGESFLRVGMEFSYRGLYPHPFDHTPINARELSTLVDSEEFKFIAAYQNHLLHQFAPHCHAHQIMQIEQLQVFPVPQLTKHNHLAPAFPGSPFTTAQFNLGNGMNIMKRDAYDDFGSLRVVTVLGNYDPAQSLWFLYWPEEEGDRFTLCCPPGTTVLIPASIVCYAFSEIQQGETRYLFQQYFNAALGRWVKHGGLSDADFKVGLSMVDWAACHLGRFDCVQSRLVLLSRVGELFM
ncbi:hypothetical protein MVEN_02370900 [Mycena venus]|uniref:Uncharacterized protein n=1 Tax=Mycena venus TaxID=2733690 RepID=A0A8H6X280_9AGAR|nr:hypothetical protein MVEN_02370900 [Mycena venus]